MKRKGEILIWDLEKIETTKANLADLGFDKYLPRNNNNEILTKALVEFRKQSDDKVIYRRFNEDSDSSSVAIFNENVTDNDLSLDKEITVNFDKKTGVMTTTNTSHPTFKTLVELYRANSGTINTDQLRKMILKCVKEEAYGVSIRRNGGAYFVDDRYKENLQNVEKIFSQFPANATLHRIVVYDDQSSMEAIEASVKGDLSNDIENLILDINKEFAAGTITERKLESRKEMAEAILGKMKAHEDNLRDSYLKVHNELASVRKALDDVTSKVSTGIQDASSFMDLLGKV